MTACYQNILYSKKKIITNEIVVSQYIDRRRVNNQ